MDTFSLKVADYRLAHTVKSGPAEDGEERAVYSFCMCPGGQIVPTSITADEVCVNGMSFSKVINPPPTVRFIVFCGALRESLHGGPGLHG